MLLWNVNKTAYKCFILLLKPLTQAKLKKRLVFCFGYWSDNGSNNLKNKCISLDYSVKARLKKTIDPYQAQPKLKRGS